MFRFPDWALPILLMFAIPTSTASAHFVWLVPETSDTGPSRVHVYFGEDGTDNSTDYLARVTGIQLKQVIGRRPPVDVKVAFSDEGITPPIDLDSGAIVIARHDHGIFDRGDSVFRLKYYAKAGPDLTHSAWQSAKTEDDLRLDLVPNLRAGRVQVAVTLDGKPLAAAQVVATRPGMDDFHGETDAAGTVRFPVVEAGLHSIRARYVEKKSGELDGRSYPETRHYVTAAVTIPASGLPVAARLQDLPQPVTSFGAAVIGDGLYLYGGHRGCAHSYSRTAQSNRLSRLDLVSGRWSDVAEGPPLQGLALVAFREKLYRIGGFTAKNEDGEDHVLVSQDEVACFDPSTGRWQQMPSLPEARSSHDAAVVGDAIYVVGGWALSEADETEWHTTAWQLDLAAEQPQWKEIAAPPFQRRALTVAAHQGKLYVVGGMQREGGPTTAVAVYDPASDLWTEGPSLQVKAASEPHDAARSRRSMSSGAMTGFGASAFATGGSLYVTTVQGTLQRLSQDLSTWEIIAQDMTPRFFHRLLPLNETHLVAVGGANMKIGKFEKVDIIPVEKVD